jgi:hypothetical protein
MRIDPSHVSSPGVQSSPLGMSRQPQQVAAPVGKQVADALFGRPPPTRLDPSQFPELAAMLKQLGRFKKKFSALAGDSDDAYQLVLADFSSAAIDAEGVIYMGAQFLRENRQNPEVILGALAHEIGHQPKRWRVGQRPRRQGQPDSQPGSAGGGGQGDADDQADPNEARQLTQNQLDELCQIEETRADLFAGVALAELGYDCEPLIRYLAKHEAGPHPRYLPALDRGEIIRGACEGRRQVLKSRRQLFPGYERHRAARGHIGSL